MAEHTPEAVAEALQYFRTMTAGRTINHSQAASHDEVLMTEVERLQAHHDALVTALEDSVLCIETACQAIGEATGRQWRGGVINEHLATVRAVLAKTKETGNGR